MRSNEKTRILFFFIYVILIFVFLIPFIRAVHSSGVADDYHQANTNVFSNVCYESVNEEGWSDINPALTGILCYINEVYFKRLYAFHSGHRPHGSTASQHYIGNAIDFHVSDYDGMSYCERAKRYYLDWETLSVALDPIKDMIGFGLYPQANNPFFHFDLGGGFRSWARIDMDYVAYQAGIEYMEEELNLCEGEQDD